MFIVLNGRKSRHTAAPKIEKYVFNVLMPDHITRIKKWNHQLTENKEYLDTKRKQNQNKISQNTINLSIQINITIKEKGEYQILR